MTTLRLALSTGEPAGIGPDLAVQLAQKARAEELVVLCEPALLIERARLLRLPLTLREFDATAPARPGAAGEICVLPIELAQACEPGWLNPANASYVMAMLSRAVDGCMDGSFDAMVTAPVQKSIINDAGIAFTGHTEFLAEATGTDQVVMLLACEQMRVALLTTHLPLANVPSAVTTERLERVITTLQRDLVSRFGINDPSIAVLGLNPHAGESGHMGREEIDVIIPCLERLREQGLQLVGPLPADTAFAPRVLEQADAILAMYHDQGLPVLKYAGFGAAVNITLGLPIVRTSVDHGTALDLAGTGKADVSSLEYATHCAAALARGVTP